jgi:hypothetical protein
VRKLSVATHEHYTSLYYNLYYKELRQLKTFLTQIGPTLPLTSDPPVICFWKWIGWKDYEVPKNRNLESVSAKKIILFSPMPTLPAGPALCILTYAYVPLLEASRRTSMPCTHQSSRGGGALRVGCARMSSSRQITEAGEEGREREASRSSPGN